MRERISKILSAYGICSRRAAEALILDGRVTVNGIQAELGQKADAEIDVICVDDHALAHHRAKYCYIMLHKPRGYVTTVSDEKGRHTVMDLVGDVSERIWPVGRLDMDSEGLLILTNDGDFTNQLTHPRHEVEKTYHVWVSGDVASALPVLKNMTHLDGEAIRKPYVKVIQKDESKGILSVTIHEGKNRQVRRMCAAAGVQVMRLKRVREGSVSLGDLPMGKWRALTEEEIELLKNS